jgi:hypothetical protein
MLKMRISGYYRSGKDKKPYNNVEVIMPDCPKDRVTGNLINRVVPVVFGDYTDRGKCHFDKLEKDDKLEPSFAGKSIKELEDEEIQQLAIAFDLVEVPLYHNGSLWETRREAYRAYCNKVKGMNLDADFDYSNAEDVVLPKRKAPKKVEEVGISA